MVRSHPRFCLQACQGKLEVQQRSVQALQALLEQQAIQLGREDKAQFTLVARDWEALQAVVAQAAAEQPAATQRCDEQLQQGKPLIWCSARLNPVIRTMLHNFGGGWSTRRSVG